MKLRLEEEIDKFSTTLNRNSHYIKTSRISRLPAYLSVNLIRFFYKEKNSINAKILKDVKFTLNLDLYELCTPELQAKLLPMRQKFKEVEDKKAEEVASSKVAKKASEPGEEVAKKEYYPYSFDDDLGSNNSGMYSLNAVLTHKGRSSSSGHYVGWIKKNGKFLNGGRMVALFAACNLLLTLFAHLLTLLYTLSGQWYKCDDDVVSQVTEEEILKLSGGGKLIDSPPAPQQINHFTLLSLSPFQVIGTVPMSSFTDLN